MNEVEFLTNFWDPKEVPRPKVVYAGAAPGQHVEILSQMFPDVEWHLYDPSKFSIKPSEKIKIYTGDEGYFTNRQATKWSRRNDVFFISDIRGPYRSVIDNLSLEQEYEKLQKDPKYASDILKRQEANEQLVADDMQSQKEWYKIIRPVHAMLKFRLPYAYKHFKKEFNYLDGFVYFQPWVGPNSTETRLVPIGYGEIEWDIGVYEEQMFHFNRVTRISKYANPFKDRQPRSAIQWPVLTNDFDSLLHVHILMDYLTKFNINFNTDMVLKLSDTIIYGINVNFTRKFNFLNERKKVCTVFRKGYESHE
jgi:cap2 methyltransferase